MHQELKLHPETAVQKELLDAIKEMKLFKFLIFICSKNTLGKRCTKYLTYYQKPN